MYTRNASGGNALPVGDIPFQWGPFHASGGRAMQEVGVPSQWGPHHASGGHALPVGAALNCESLQ